jgi:hypothetical protein
MHVHTGFIASDESWQSWLDNIVEQGKFAMVIIDTLGTVAGEIDTDKSGELMTKMLRPLRSVARKHDTAICVVHHNKKAANQGGRAGQDMLGSTALHAWVECAIYARSKDANGEVQIEREAKLAMDMGMRVRIPQMFENHVTGERQLWDPEVIPEGLETEPEGPNEPRASHEPVQSTRKEQYEHRPAGGMLAVKLKEMGGARRALSLDEILEVMGGTSKSSIIKQLESGVENGLLSHENDTWLVIR